MAAESSSVTAGYDSSLSTVYNQDPKEYIPVTTSEITNTVHIRKDAFFDEKKAVDNMSDNVSDMKGSF